VTDSEQPIELADAITEANAAFSEMSQERHNMGAEKYGAFKFLGANTLEEAMFELVDLGNYARYTFIKLYLMNLQISAKYGEMDMPASFTPSKPGLSSSLPQMFGDNS
jgi:hypothetical protein